MSLVMELQRDALNPDNPVSNLLRKALVIATKLDLKNLENWITLELSGYPDQDLVPDYRTLIGQIEVWNPFHG